MWPLSVPVCPCAASSWAGSSPRLSAPTLLPRALREHPALWDQRAATNTDMSVPLRPHVAKAGNPIPDQTEITSAAAWLLTRATIRVKSLSSHQCKGMARRTTRMEPSARLRSMKSHMKADHTKIRKLLRCLSGNGVFAHQKKKQRWKSCQFFYVTFGYFGGLFS